jgi:hypothetical protein
MVRVAWMDLKRSTEPMRNLRPISCSGR